MKKTITMTLMLLSTVFCSRSNSQTGIPIPEEYFGLNAWLINVADPVVSTFGDKFEDELDEIAKSGVRWIRIGGIAPLWDQLYNFNSSQTVTLTARLEHLVNEIRNRGMDVMIQVAYAPATYTSFCGVYTPSVATPLGALTLSQQAQVAANLVHRLNNPFTGIYKDRPIRYWIIANEPDGSINCSNPNGYGYGTSASASDLASYLKMFSRKMKEADPLIQTMGPELNNFSTANGSNSNNIMNELLSVPNSTNNSVLGTFTVSDPGSPSSVFTVNFIDIVTFHNYPQSATSAAAVIGLPSHTASGISAKVSTNENGFSGIVQKLLLAGRTPGTNTYIGCTEFNIDTDVATDEATQYAAMINGFGARSFLGGQWLTEMYAEGLRNQHNGVPWMKTMCLWSAREGGCSGGFPIGYISNCNSSSVNGIKRPMYWHYQMMARNFDGVFYPAASITSTVQNVKAFASRSDEKIAVMLLNQGSNDYTFEISLNSSSTATKGELNVGFNIPAAAGSSLYFASGANTITLERLKANSTTVVIYNCAGLPSFRFDYSKAGAMSHTFEPVVSPNLGTHLLGQLVGFSPSSLSTSPGQNSVQVTMTPSTFTYTWSGPCGHPVETNSTGSVAYIYPCNQGLGDFIYTYTASDGICKTTKKITLNSSVAVGSSTAFAAWVTSSNATCGINNGTAYVHSKNDIYPLYFSWDGGPLVTSNSASGLAAGPHSVAVSHGTVTWNLRFFIDVKNETRPRVDLGVDKTGYRYCSSTLSAYPDLTLQGYYHYEWYKGNSTVPFATVNPVVVTNWSSEQYRVKVFDWTNGCSNWDTLNVKVINGNCTDPRITDAYSIPCDPSFNASYRSAVSITTETLSGVTVINRDHFLDRVLVVPEGATLRIEDCELACANAASIIVQPGGSLKIIKTYMHPCGNGPWGGIVVVGKAGGVNGTEDDMIEITESVIKDAAYAIRLNSTKGALVQGNIIINGTVGISLDQSFNFDISRNRMHSMGTAIASAESPQSSLGSVISENYFVGTGTCIASVSDNLSDLSIECNRFNNYTDYAIYSENSTLADQGSSMHGAGNTFSSSSQNVNHQLRHNGSPVTYYCDPSHSFTLSQTGGLTAIAQIAADDGACPVAMNRSNGIVAEKDNDNENAIKLQAFPNPFSDQLNIIYELPADVKQASVIITEPAGRIVYARPLDLNTTSMTLEGLALSNGVYICSVVAHDGRSKHFKLISIK